MDSKDDEKRRVMTPPAQWTSGTLNKGPADLSEPKNLAGKALPSSDELDKLSGSTGDSADWLENDFSDALPDEDSNRAATLGEEKETAGAVIPGDSAATSAEVVMQTAETASMTESDDSTGEEATDRGDSWLDLDSALAGVAEVLAPAPEAGNSWGNEASLNYDPAVKNTGPDTAAAGPGTSTFNTEHISSDETSNDVKQSFAEPTDASPANNGQDDDDWLDSNSAINKAPLPESEAPITQTQADAELLLTDHAAVPVRKFPIWPTLSLVAALILLLVGGWGALSERSALKARIQALEQSSGRSKAAGDLDAQAERALREDNQSLRLQRDTLREQYGALSDEISALRAMLSKQTDTQGQVAEYAEDIADSTKSEAAAEITTDEMSEPVLAAKSVEAPSINDTVTPIEASAIPLATGGPWFVNLGSHVDRDVATKSIQQFKPLDKQLVIVEGNVKGRTYYRVRAINFPTQGEAKAAAKLYETTFKMKPLWVGKAPAASAASVSPSPAAEQPASTLAAKVELKTNAGESGWFIYIDTFARSNDADNRAQLINDAGFEAKVAVEFRQGELFYRVQVVGIESEAQGEKMIATLKSLEDMPNLQLRRF